MADKKQKIDETVSDDVSRVHDILVTAIIALVGTAVALGLYLQAGFSIVPSLFVGSGLFIWLLSAHFLITRMRLKRLMDGRIHKIADDVSKLQKETEITDLLAEGHNELTSGQDALENAIRVIVGRIDQYDHRLKVLYKLSKQNTEQLKNAYDSEAQEQRFLEMQEELKKEFLRLRNEIQTFENRFDESSHQQYSLIKAELDVLELVVRQMDAADDQSRSQFTQKSLQVIAGLRQLPVMKEIAQDVRQSFSNKVGVSAGGSAYFDSVSMTGESKQTDAVNEMSHQTNIDLNTHKDAEPLTLTDDHQTIEAQESSDFSEGIHQQNSSGSPKSTESENLLATVSEAIEANRIELFMQPIVTLPDRDLVYYEVFSRLRNELGQLILPRDFLGVTDMAGLTPIIDNQIILQAIQVVQRLISRNSAKILFCNLSMTSLRDADFFAEFMDFMEANKWLSEHLVFEFSQEGFDSVGAFEHERLNAIARLGFRFSLDRINRLDIDFKSLSEMNFSFVKIDAGILLGNVMSARAEIHPADLDPYLRRLNITLIVDGVERESLVRQLKDFNVSRAQGNLFCEPKPVRPEVFQNDQAVVA